VEAPTMAERRSQLTGLQAGQLLATVIRVGMKVMMKTFLSPLP